MVTMSYEVEIHLLRSDGSNFCGLEGGGTSVRDSVGCTQGEWNT